MFSLEFTKICNRKNMKTKYFENGMENFRDKIEVYNNICCDCSRDLYDQKCLFMAANLQLHLVTDPEIRQGFWDSHLGHEEKIVPTLAPRQAATPGVAAV